MNYVKANAVLPEELLKEIQKYVQGETLYIPKPKGAYQKWGACSGARESIANRNATIKQSFQKGTSIEELSEAYFLSPETIKKIIYTKRK
ncbi:CD3324 family protein [Salirhabdus sp. Marseille-P4669]|uniref:CD3324 family protein n=1 Tax=Salirhabdus sp. Marseille-P4669 TaxID=2042310 RepID=UPI000C7A8BC8|nr:CD3324 family protein [Salirhabdus sp. Marseille-P4669]